MGRFYDKVCQPETLNQAYNNLRGANGRWDCRLRAYAVRLNPVLPMLRIMQELWQREYRSGSSTTFNIERGDGTSRAITCYNVRDRLVQRACLLAVQPVGERLFLSSSYGFRPGLTVDMATARVREWVREGRAWLVDADIVRCFDRIPVANTLRLLSALTGDDEFVHLVARWLPGGSDACGLPQGMVLSPFLSNLYLHSFDLSMRGASIPMVRYADDFVLLLETQRAAQAAREVARQRLASLHLELHPGKSKVIRAAPKHQFLGKRLPDANKFLRAA